MKIEQFHEFTEEDYRELYETLEDIIENEEAGTLATGCLLTAEDWYIIYHEIRGALFSIRLLKRSGLINTKSFRAETSKSENENVSRETLERGNNK